MDRAEFPLATTSFIPVTIDATPSPRLHQLNRHIPLVLIPKSSTSAKQDRRGSAQGLDQHTSHSGPVWDQIAPKTKLSIILKALDRDMFAELFLNIYDVIKIQISDWTADNSRFIYTFKYFKDKIILKIFGEVCDLNQLYTIGNVCKNSF